MKKYILLIMLLLVALPILSQSRKKVAVVLSGGGAKGVAHIGALKVIDEVGIPIDMVIGTSMGSIIGGLYSIGYDPAELDSLVRSQDWPYLLSDRIKHNEKTFVEKEEDGKYLLSLPFKESPKEIVPEGLVKGQNLDNLFSSLTVGYHDSIDFNKLPIPFACVAVDLVQGEEVVFHRGKLSEAMRASMAIPAVFTPVRIDSMVLVDGGLINNYPVDVARSMGAEIIIGVDVQSGTKDTDKIVSVADMVGKIVDISSQNKYKTNLKETDVYIKVDVKGYTAGSFNPEALDTLTRRGEEAARIKQSELVDLKRKVGNTEDYNAETKSLHSNSPVNKSISIAEITFSGLEGKDDKWLLHKCLLEENKEITFEQLQESISSLYTTQIFTNVSFQLNKREDGRYDLHFKLEENKINSFNLGLRFDSEEVASVLLNGVYYLKTRMSSRASVTGRLGKRSGVRLDYTLLPTHLRFFNFSYMYQYNDINIYRHGSREYNTTYHYNMGEISYLNIFNRNVMLSGGLRYEYFHYKNFLFNDERNTLSVKPGGFFSYFAGVRYESLDNQIYPTKGASLQANVALYTDNLIQYKDRSPFSALSVWWKIALSPGSHFTLTPSIYSRVLIGQEAPYPLQNTMGGDMAGRYVPHQLPFAGIGYMVAFDSSLVTAGIQARQRVGKNHYFMLNVNYAMSDNDFFKIFKGRDIIGTSLGYGYNSIFGPLEGSFNWSNETRQLGFYLNIGYKF